jgi:hypothetical protein
MGWFDDWEKKAKENISCEFRRLHRIWPDGVHAIIVEYSGSGDSGMFEFGSLEDDDGNEVEMDVLPVLMNEMTPYERWDESARAWIRGLEPKNIPLDEIAISLGSSVAGLHSPGWENNDGAQGRVVITKTQATIEHNTNIMTTEYSERTVEPYFTPMELLGAALEEDHG